MEIQSTNNQPNQNMGSMQVNNSHVSDITKVEGTEITQTVEKHSVQQDQQITRSTDGVAERLLIDAIEKANSKASGENAEYSFSVHSATKQIMIKVTDKVTGEVIKEIPSKKALDAVAMMWEFAGILVDEKR